jgi:hypothetical protein
VEGEDQGGASGSDDAGGEEQGERRSGFEAMDEGQESMEARQRYELLGLALQEARTSLLGALGGGGFDAL